MLNRLSWGRSLALLGLLLGTALSPRQTMRATRAGGEATRPDGFAAWTSPARGANAASLGSEATGTLAPIDPLAQHGLLPGRSQQADPHVHPAASEVMTSTRSPYGLGNHEKDGPLPQAHAGAGGRPLRYRYCYGAGIYRAQLQIDLSFIELEETEPGRRIFDVTVDGAPLVSGLDLCAVAGPQTAYAVSRVVTVTYQSGRDPCIDIAFVPRVGQPCYSGVTVQTLSAIPQHTVALPVARPDDDAHVVLQGSSQSRRPFLRLGRYDDGFEYAAGLLFRQLWVPHRALISSAWLEVSSYPAAGWQYGPADVTVHAQAADSASGFSWLQARVDDRPRTAAGARWLIEGAWPPGQTFRSVDLSPVLQEVVDRPGWWPGSNLALLILPNPSPVGWRDIVARDWPGDPGVPATGMGATLHVTYVLPEHRPATR